MRQKVVKSIKSLGWSALKLTQKKYRGGIQVYSTEYGVPIPIYFYIDECFIIEDEDGLFSKDDLKDFFMKSEVDLESTGCIQGLQLVGYIEETDTGAKEVILNTELLSKWGIDTEENMNDIQNRLYEVYKMGELVDVDVSVK